MMKSNAPLLENAALLTADQLPQHIAVVMDGNGRWAKQRHLPRVMGHRAGLEAAKRIVKSARRRGINVMSLFAFSTENWKRSSQEVNELMKLLMLALQRELKLLHDHQIRLKVIGERRRLSEAIQHSVMEAETATANYEAMTLVIALNYGGQWDITQAAWQLAKDITADKVSDETITPDQFSRYLSLSDFPLPDLFIRTSGECRISNFFLWQLAYTELYFTDQLWPDFNEAAFDRALLAYANRKRRFGCEA